ncbi:MAG: tRNA (N(6)-L-threonylcarbamoyladenosine(37)-C(2))-methylthiotransferase MtaB [Planctomycetaceae bacterium]
MPELLSPLPAVPDHAPSADARTCRLVTLGCKVNQYETQLVKEGLERHGYREAAEGEPASLCLVNTCTVTAEADSKARQIIRQLARQNPGTSTVVFGCYAAHGAQELGQLPGVVAVVEDSRELPDVLQRFGVHDWPGGISRFDGHRRAFVKVQDGCLLNCTYCIIPQVRPGLRSREAGEILAEVSRLVEHGHREIVLTGIHLGHYGVENTRGRSGRAPYRLRHLLREIDRLPGDFRVRLSSLEAGEVDDAFIDTAADCHRLCPHFHLCLQSGSDGVLARMRRRYRVAGFLAKVARIRERFDQPAFSTDVIVGFPGETDAEFEETLAACRAAQFMKIHTFPFSPRKGTPAAGFEGQVHAAVRQERVARLGLLEGELQRQYYRSLVGRDLEVMIEARPASTPGWVQGTACRYAPVEFPYPPGQVGRLVPVRVTGVGEVARGVLQAQALETNA